MLKIPKSFELIVQKRFMVLVPGVDLIKLFWRKFTHTFLKLYLSIHRIYQCNGLAYKKRE